jgi:hypothetical protein
MVLPALLAPLVLRRARVPLATASTIALATIVIGWIPVVITRAWFAPPHLDVPPPFWMVAIPTIDVAAVACAGAAVLVLVLGAVMRPRARAQL